MKLWFDAINGDIVTERDIQRDHVEWVTDKISELGKDWVRNNARDFTLAEYLECAADFGGLVPIENADEFRYNPNNKADILFYEPDAHILCGEKRLRELYKSWLPEMVNEVGLEEVVNSGNFTYEKYVDEWIDGMGSEFYRICNPEYEEV